jgi:signal transduction histidine kinase
VLLAYVAGAALSIALLVLVSVAIVFWQGDVLSGTAVAERAEDLARMLRFDDAGEPVGFDDRDGDLAAWLYDGLEQDTAYRVLDASGRVVLSSAAGAAFWPTDGMSRRLEPGRFEFEREGVRVRAATAAIEHEGGTWFLQFAASERFLQLIYRAFALPFTGVGIALFSVVLLFVFGACAFVTLRYTLRPLRELSDLAAAISPRSLHRRLPAATVPAEIAPLVDSFNSVLERLERGYRTQQEFLATAAHELKTPLTLIRAQIELMDGDEARVSLLDDVGHMTRQVQQLLLLAEASEVQGYRFADLDVGDVAKEAVGYLQRKADAAGVRLASPEGPAGVRWLADRGALFTLLKNLLENAIEHAPRGTAVRVEVGSEAMSVCDRGPGVSEEQLAQIFSRFWRGAHRRDHGAGLGLAICQEIAFAHGWTLSAHRENPGLRVRVALTASESPVRRG